MKESGRDDLRIQRTMYLIKKSLQELLTRKSLEAISVKEICDGAMIHRATFYNHFQDKYHLFSRILEDITREITGDISQGGSRQNPAEIYQEFACRVLDYVEIHREVLRLTLKNNKDSLAYIMIYHGVREVVTHLLEVNQRVVEYLLPVDIISRFVTSGLTAVVFYCIEVDTGYSREKMMDMMKQIIRQNLYYR